MAQKGEVTSRGSPSSLGRTHTGQTPNPHTLTTAPRSQPREAILPQWKARGPSYAQHFKKIEVQMEMIKIRKLFLNQRHSVRNQVFGGKETNIPRAKWGQWLCSLPSLKPVDAHGHASPYCV